MCEAHFVSGLYSQNHFREVGLSKVYREGTTLNQQIEQVPEKEVISARNPKISPVIVPSPCPVVLSFMKLLAPIFFLLSLNATVFIP